MSRIIIVDDHEQDRYLLETILKSAGHDIFAYANGADALKMARKNPPDMIVSDILMPTMDGFVLCREWRRDPQLMLIPFVYYTATYTDPRDEKFALENGADRFIIKPEEPGLLLRKLEEVLRADFSGSRPERAIGSEDAGYLKMYSDTLVRKLEDKVELFNTMFNMSPNILFLLSPSLVIKEINNKAQSLLGIQGASVVDNVIITDFIDEKARADFTGLLAGVVNGININEFDCRVKAGDGWRIVSWSAGRIVRSSGTVYGMYLVGNDITEKVEAQKKIKEVEFQLGHAQKMEALGQLASGIAHDFRNYISGIYGMSELVSLQIDATSPLQESLTSIFRTCENSTRLTEQLLTFSRKKPHAPQVLDLNDQLAKMDKLLVTLLGGIRLIIDTDYDLFPVKADPGQIEQIIMNLVVNARDAIGEAGEVIISTRNVSFDVNDSAPFVLLAPGQYAVLEVIDTGSGMDTATMSHIFEPFFTTKGEGKGTGLGLSTVYGIVHQNDGFIQCDSRPGEGTTFTIYFPKAAS